ncbi:MAG: SMI1/KNR4 family protein [Planctomycetes bacterium]|nr:SMI1/KNR4 family protein [Planctomycetota bacterium]
MFRKRIPRGFICIGCDPGGNQICICLKGVKRGSVFFWDHEDEMDEDDWDGTLNEAENVTRLAVSFSEFVKGLRTNVQ